MTTPPTRARLLIILPITMLVFLLLWIELIYINADPMVNKSHQYHLKNKPKGDEKWDELSENFLLTVDKSLKLSSVHLTYEYLLR